ncbi:MAG TPA: hypothetical protein VF980_10720 [Thermoanaerobaculia bacterium]
MNFRRRFPYFLVSIGLLIVVIYPRLGLALPAFWRGDFVTGVVIGAGIGIELVGVIALGRRSACAS